ncbi:hypothetical protein [Lacinutrix salivirga]
MKKAIRLQRQLLIFGIPLLIIGLMAIIAKSSIFKTNPDKLAIGITFDLLLIVPFIYYLLIRKTSIPKTTVVPFLILGVIICTVILPKENQYYLSLFKTWMLPIVELSVVTFVIYKVRKALRTYKLKKDTTSDFFTTLKHTCSDIFPKGIVMPIVTEIAVFYYGFIYWKKRELKVNEFSYHKNSGTLSLLVALIIIIAVETVVLHPLLSKWSVIAAWSFTFLSLYSGIQLFGFLKSMLKRPIVINTKALVLNYGIMNEVTINIEDIDSLELNTKDIVLNNDTRKLSILGELESHNCILHLKKQYTLIGLYGIQRHFKTIVFYVDEQNKFKKQILSILNQTQN